MKRQQQPFPKGDLARAIERVIEIGRPTVEPEVGAIAAELDLPLRRLVARLAQALELAGHEGIPIAPVRDDVIHHLCGCDDAAVETELAQRMALQLQLPQPLPKPVLDLRTPSRAAMGRPARLRLRCTRRALPGLQ